MVMFCIGAWLAPVAHAQLIGGLLGGDNSSGSGSTDSGASGGGLLDGLLGGGSSGSTDSGSTDTGSTDSGSTDSGSGSGSGGGLLGSVVDGLTGNNDSPESSDSGSSSGSGNGLIGGVIDVVDKTVDKVTNTVDTGGTVDKVVEGTVGAVGGAVGSLSGAGETIKKITKDRDGKSGSGKGSVPNRPSTPVEAPPMDTWEVLGKDYGTVTVDSRATGTTVLTSSEGTSTVASIEDSVISQIGRIATEAVQQAAFPLILTMLVIAFLTIQNRIDRKDPKLALAPVDSEQDLLSFT